MKNIIKKLNKVVLTVLLLSLLPLEVYAAGAALVVDLGSEDGLSTSNICVELIRVDSTKGDDLSIDRAKAIHRHVLAQGLTGTVKATDNRGEVRFFGLEKGLYLVFERGGQSVTFAPYLAWIESGTLISEPKIEESGSHTFTVTKQWADGNDADNIRPSAVEVSLLRDGEAYRKVSLSAGNGWNHTFTNLPEGEYTVKEQAVDGYQAAYKMVDGGVQIVNSHKTHKPDAVEVTVTVVWNDDDNAADKRPATVTVQLIRDQTVIKTAAVSETNGWTVTFSGLSEANYSVRQFPVDEYTTTYSFDGGYHFVVTNTYSAPGEVTPGGEPGGEPGGDRPGELPEDPVTPGDPDGPTIPQMGAVTWPIYALLACGVVLIVSGVTVLKRGRREQ